ncbi:MAG: type II toxin-antitoxin system HicB family antitoxin [Spirochaetota bacterium]|nr:type II toxin-antitoxin system HicB family antitoxin [Spirochaetota bacterium]
MKKTLTAIVYKDINENIFIAECPDVGSLGRGNTIELALEDLKQVTEDYLREDTPASEITRPLMTTFDVEFRDVL